jgi:hypothetical protein
MNIPEKWAYPAVIIGVAGHASSEFFDKRLALSSGRFRSHPLGTLGP